jgi:hypothetical protein
VVPNCCCTIRPFIGSATAAMVFFPLLRLLPSAFSISDANSLICLITFRLHAILYAGGVILIGVSFLMMMLVRDFGLRVSIFFRLFVLMWVIGWTGVYILFEVKMFHHPYVNLITLP